MSIEEYYPNGTEGDLAVCYINPNESTWVFCSVSDRSEADRKLKATAALRRNVYQVITKSGPNAGRPCPVVWISKCTGERWERTASFGKGTEEYLERWRPEDQ
jgi:hypothetical protein